jgi:aspartate racemase
MEPEATLTLFKEIIDRTPAEKDQDHIRVIIDNNPKIPDRTDAILGKGKSPLPEKLKSYHTVEKAGVDFILIPCISAHVYLDELRDEASIEILSAFEEVANMIVTNYNHINKIGLLATAGTISGGLFQKKLAEKKITTLVPEKESLDLVMSAIYTIKGVNPPNYYANSKLIFKQAAKLLINKGAQGIIAGCTEIPLAFDQDDVDVPLFNPLLILAESAIRRVKQ